MKKLKKRNPVYWVILTFNIWNICIYIYIVFKYIHTFHGKLYIRNNSPQWRTTLPLVNINIGFLLITHKPILLTQCWCQVGRLRIKVICDLMHDVMNGFFLYHIHWKGWLVSNMDSEEQWKNMLKYLFKLNKC